MIYLISLFYGILFMYTGFQFMISGHDVVKREMAKEWLANVVVMIILIQASFYLYQLTLDVGASMSSAVLSLVDQNFFKITGSNLINLGLEIIFVFIYAIILLITLLILTIRYLLLAFGILLVPIGIFCYFIPPLRAYGNLIINSLGVLIFITFFISIIILGSSLLIEQPIFENMKILLMITCFFIVDLVFVLSLKLTLLKATIPSPKGKLTLAINYIKGRNQNGL